MNKKQQGGKVMLIGGSLILVGLVVAIIIGVFFFKKPTPPVQEEEPKVTYESKETKDLVTTYSSSEKIEVNKDFSKLGVSATLSNEEYRNKVQQVSTVVANGFQEVDQVDKDAVFGLLNEALSTLTIDEGFGSASPALSQFTIMLNNYFGGSQGNPMISLNVLLTHIKSKVNTVNLSKTSTPGKIAIEFVIEDYDGNQLGYVTGYFGDYTKRFEVTSAFPLGYGQDYLNKTVPKNFPKSQGVE